MLILHIVGRPLTAKIIQLMILFQAQVDFSLSKPSNLIDILDTVNGEYEHATL